MFSLFRHWRENRRLARLPVTRAEWENAVADWSVARRYQGADRERLCRLALRFLVRKRFESGGQLELSNHMQLRVATMAAVPILNLGLDWYDNFYSVILYPAEFIPEHEYEDDFGVIHRDRHPLSGEAWQQGPVILSWEDVLKSGREPGYNVVIHEMAHKLDMLHDGPNGSPPLHRGMDPEAWRRAFTEAWQALEALDEAGEEEWPIDPYALENPGEFFSVVCEVFFETPAHLKQLWPAVYAQLCAFYRQDPLAEAPASHAIHGALEA
ncbi:M90 family metallopeptidase [Natronospira bacteriovora]|uniref:Zinc-dependent peptidase n=1 Tax=Natronospira bacteriovora TaxID=3069753 RepID=A0ABU0W9J6_9GAMM|nr:M90 family metallopeptidase [Natronospira sp. AB-CW4]MDQ2070671.1 zinc-dependent peptidase [Natronospira sp. AB-CW4]